jgi:hypothetical protein
MKLGKGWLTLVVPLILSSKSKDEAVLHSYFNKLNMSVLTSLEKRISNHCIKISLINQVMLVTMLLCSFAWAQEPPAMEILSPQANQTYNVGDTMVIKWIAHGGGVPGDILPTISIDEGKTWIWLAHSPIKSYEPGIYKDTVGTYKWVVQDSMRSPDIGEPMVSIVFNACQVQVFAPYEGGTYGPGYSASFSISKNDVGIVRDRHTYQHFSNHIGNTGTIILTKWMQPATEAYNMLGKKSFLDAEMQQKSVAGFYLVKQNTQFNQ